MGSFRRFASRSLVLYDNSVFFLVSGFTMKLGALLLCLCIVASQGRVLREKRETEEGLVDVAAEQENDTVEEKDEGLNNDSLEDVKARGAALSKLVKTVMKNIPDGAVQKVKDAAVELVKGTVKKHLGMEEGDSLTEEPAKDTVVETDEEAGDKDTVEESDNDNNVSGAIEIKIIVKNIPKGTVQKIKDEAVDLVNGTVKKHLGLEEGDSVPEEPKKQKRDTNENEEEENGKNNLSDLVGTIIDKIPQDTFEKVKEGLGNIPAIQVKEKVKEGLDSLPLDNVKETIKNLATNIEDS